MLKINKNALGDLVSELLALMHVNIARIILYGSVARGTDEPGSDIDIALITPGEISDNTRCKLLDLSVDLDLKYGKVFSLICIDEKVFAQRQNILPFYMNIINEGVILWSAA